MKVFREIHPLQRFVRSCKRQGLVGLVTTMGNLHQGHMALIEQAKQLVDTVIVSIFVNPLQFAPHEDFQSYPRTEGADREKLYDAGVQGVFIPTEETLFPQGQDNHTQVIVPLISDMLCGVTRPGFFQGIATILTKLFNIVQPDYVVYGEKDFQQLCMVQQMVQQLSFPIGVLGVPTLRESDGLAYSSRNQYLSDPERALAPRLYEHLQDLVDSFKQAPDNFCEGIKQTTQALTQLGFDVDYLELRHSENLAIPQPEDKELRLLAAANLGHTRLIDNVPLIR